MLKITVLCPNCGTQSNVFSGNFGIFPDEMINCANCDLSYSVHATTIGVNKHSAVTMFML